MSFLRNIIELVSELLNIYCPLQFFNGLLVSSNSCFEHYCIPNVKKMPFYFSINCSCFVPVCWHGHSHWHRATEDSCYCKPVRLLLHWAPVKHCSDVHRQPTSSWFVLYSIPALKNRNDGTCARKETLMYYISCRFLVGPSHCCLFASDFFHSGHLQIKLEENDRGGKTLIYRITVHFAVNSNAPDRDLF